MPFNRKLKVILDPVKRAEYRMREERKVKVLTSILERKERALDAHKKALDNPQLKIPSEVELSPEYIPEVGKQIRNNDIFADFYYQLYETSNDYIVDENGEVNKTNFRSTLLNNSYNIRNCGKSWFFDHYGMQQVYDLKNVYYCHDKFCLHCQKLLQATRLQKYSPLIEDLLEQGKYLYHVTLTIPNTTVFTRKIVKRLFDNFKRLIRYFSADAKNALGWSNYGFIGAIRSFEVTYDPVSYHPHIHSVIALDNPLPDDACLLNKYSYKKENGKWVFDRLFTEFEVSLQKVWRLLYEGQKVTLKNVDALDLGYSATVDKIDNGNYYEIFKYTIKLQKSDDDDFAMTFENFKTLYYALHSTHIFQGYGIFYSVKCDTIDETLSEKYDYIVAQLQLIEKPLMTSLPIEDIALKMLSSPETKFISRKTIYKFLREHPEFLTEKTV